MSLTDQIAAYFKAHPGQWIDGKVLAHVGGGYAWRSRIADCRTQRGMTIENRVRRVKSPAGLTYAVSEYRYLAERTNEIKFNANTEWGLR